jgi:hypothetical protein
LQTVFPGWPWTLILQISASQVARITGMSHWCQAKPLKILISFTFPFPNNLVLELLEGKDCQFVHWGRGMAGPQSRCQSQRRDRQPHVCVGATDMGFLCAVSETKWDVWAAGARSHSNRRWGGKPWVGSQSPARVRKMCTEMGEAIQMESLSE